MCRVVSEIQLALSLRGSNYCRCLAHVTRTIGRVCSQGGRCLSKALVGRRGCAHEVCERENRRNNRKRFSTALGALTIWHQSCALNLTTNIHSKIFLLLKQTFVYRHSPFFSDWESWSRENEATQITSNTGLTTCIIKRVCITPFYRKDAFHGRGRCSP